ncbi:MULTISPECIES: efflux RND transporter permease subunit [Burkholderiaceae]|uniref:Transporter n=1 Tax=Pandoraea apista TaxID=93218 RepID=A0A5E5P593_9BURK|nr:MULTISPECIES: efflux RND transporter permease subunit [Burkholderiaceae]MBR8052091.1 efflux RND transporter permease subunit [Burkholderia vietnamiensis]VVG71896.1 transporter [Pandoraea apista]HDR9283077.1 efflux RND transporter permease subunit [Burkholderia vietnamiensis]
MTVSEWVQGHRRSILFLVALLVLAGAAMALRLPITLFPNVDFPRVEVSLDAGDRPAEQMATLVTQPVEEAVRRVTGIKEVHSTTSRGSASVALNFGWSTNMAQATLEINAAIAQILPTLPAGTRMAVRRMDPTVFPIIAYSLTSRGKSLPQLYDLAQYQLRPLLSSVPGVARVQVVGGVQDEYRVTADPARLAARGLGLAEVARAVSASNAVSAAGRLEDHDKLYLVVANTPLASLASIRGIVVSSSPTGIVHLGDVADVQRDTTPVWTRVTAEGQDAVLLNIYQQPGSNSVAIARGVSDKLAAFHSSIPVDVTLANWYDQSQLVTASAASVRDAILIGVVLAAATLLVFLRNWKITAIAVAVVPVVIAATCVLLGVFHMGFNIMTLGGMAAAVGLVIDDAIVMIEHIVRRVRENGSANFHGRVMASALEFTRPLAGSSAATLIIFVPLAFLTGVTGAFFKALSVTMASALLISFIITLLAVPILCDHLLKPSDAEHGEGGRLFPRVQGWYAKMLSRVLARPWWLVAGLAPLLMVSWLAYARVGSGFMPAMDEGGFVLDYRMPPGTSLSESDRVLQQVEAIVKANPNVLTYSRRTGLGLGGGLSEANQGDFFIRLKDGKREPIDAVMEEIRTEIEHDVPGIGVEMAQLMEDLIGDLTAVPQPVQIKIFADDPAILYGSAKRVAGALGKIAGVVDVRDGINPAGDALDVRVQPERAALEGVDAAWVAQALSDALSGNVATRLQQGPKMVGVRVWTPAPVRSTDSALRTLMLRAPDGHLFALQRVATITPVAGQPQLERDDLKRMVAVTARISGRDLGSTVADVKHMLAAPGLLGTGAYYTLGGLYQQQQIAFQGLMAVFATAVALVFALLLFLYERFRIALAVLAMPLLAAGSVFIGLWAAGIELNISSMMGMTMIVGIVTEVAIFYVSEYRALQHEGRMPLGDALLAAGKNRLRPIAMTTIAAILALLPLALGLGQGSAMQQPLAVAIITGLTVQMPLVLLALPVLISVTMRRSRSSGTDLPR